jgi:hypothetical protein
VPMGSDRLMWNNIDEDISNSIRLTLGYALLVDGKPVSY